MRFYLQKFIVLCISVFVFSIIFLIFYPIFSANSLIFPYCVHPFDIVNLYPKTWFYIKICYLITSFICIFLSVNTIVVHFNLFNFSKAIKSVISVNSGDSFSLCVGKKSHTGESVFISEKGLYQNILITGTIGSGKTSSLMYPLSEQLIKYDNPKIGMLILDVKGNFYKQIKNYATNFNRLDDLIILELNSSIKYNPLDKPHLKPTVLANRLKTILELFSPNSSESYWLDKTEQVLSEAIKLIRLYNNNYVTFVELHNLINYDNYYQSKISVLRNLFLSGKLNKEKIYNLYSALNFFENEFKSLDSRTISILKSEITRITGTFISDFDVLNTFCPSKEDINFYGFKDVLKLKKIVVLNMNIAKYKNLSKIIAAYLKLDFQCEVLSQLEKSSSCIMPSVFICDEYHEYVTLSDADFFAQSREAKSINIVATQSYTSLLNTLGKESSVKVILQNLINKFWLRTDDIFTIESIQKQIGKEDKTKISKNISENAGETNYNFFTNSLNSKKTSISESITTHIQTDYIYDTNFFTQNLETFSCLAFLSDGSKILPPCKLNLIPYFNTFSSNNLSDKKII